MEELMQKIIISENIELSKMISDIVPKKEELFTNIELDVTKKEEFSIVIYKKENIVTRFFKSVKLIMEKLNIIKNTKEFVLEERC